MIIVLLPMCAATAKRTSADYHSSIFALPASGCYLVKFNIVSTPVFLVGFFFVFTSFGGRVGVFLFDFNSIAISLNQYFQEVWGEVFFLAEEFYF